MNTRHNILFILGDEHRYDCLGCTGNADVKTPVIDAIAGDGTVIDNTFCCYPVCTVPRAIDSSTYFEEHFEPVTMKPEI